MVEQSLMAITAWTKQRTKVARDFSVNGWLKKWQSYMISLPRLSGLETVERELAPTKVMTGLGILLCPARTSFTVRMILSLVVIQPR